MGESREEHLLGNVCPAIRGALPNGGYNTANSCKMRVYSPSRAAPSSRDKEDAQVQAPVVQGAACILERGCMDGGAICMLVNGRYGSAVGEPQLVEAPLAGPQPGICCEGLVC